MPQRTRSHRIEPESRRAFEEAIDPRFQLHPRQAPEYGIDGDVEEFDSDGHATGLHFFVQFKGTDEEDLKKALAVALKLETADYYRAADLPVLMVRYHAPTGTLYARWFHQYDPYYGRGGKKTLTFRWQEGDAWQEGTPARLAADARAFLDLRRASLELPRPIYVVTDGAFGLSPTEITLALRTAAAQRPDILKLEGGPPPPGSAWLEISDEELVANLAKVTSATLHFRTPYDPGEAGRQLAIDAFVMVALAFEHLGQDDIAGRLATRLLPSSPLVRNLDIPAALSAAMGRAHRITEALELSDALDALGDQELEEAALLFTFPALFHRGSLSDSEVKRYRQTLERRVARRKKAGDMVQVGRAYMNLASFHRGRACPDRAVSFYEEAARHDPAYLERAHYWFELGGVLWGTRQYAKAADAYGRSIELGTTQRLAVALRADCLMFAGEYAAALEQFERFNADHPEDDGEYRLKEMAVRAIIDRLGIRSQERRTKAALKAGAADEPEGPDAKEKDSRRQLEHDALWGSAWVNLGLADIERQQFGDALVDFVAATILIVQDKDAWLRAIVMAIGLTEHPVVVDLLRTGRRLVGDELVTYIVERTREHDPEFPREDVLQTIDSVLDEFPEDLDKGFTLRLLDEEGGVEEIEIRDERAEAASSTSQGAARTPRSIDPRVE